MRICDELYMCTTTYTQLHVHNIMHSTVQQLHLCAYISVVAMLHTLSFVMLDPSADSMLQFVQCLGPH